jgi:LAO/AO transport system kinase
MLELSGARQWPPPIVETIAVDGTGVDELRSAIGDHRLFLEGSGELGRRRTRRLRDELRGIVAARVATQAEARCSGAEFDALVGRVERREVDPYRAADELLPSEA